MTWMPGWSRSQAAKVSASRSGEQVHRAVGGDVHQHAAVDVAAAQRNLVHAQHGHAWSASEFAIENRVWIRQHSLGLLTRGGGSDHDRARAWLGRRAKRFLTPLQKYEIWLQLVRGETTISEAADRFGVDRSTIMRLRMVAKDGALAALADSKPGVAAAKRDVELEAAKAAAARLGEALKELAVKLVLVEGKGRWG
jgi:transposase